MAYLDVYSDIYFDTYGVPAPTGTVSSTFPAITQASAGTRTVPAFTGTAATSFPSLTQTAVGNGTVPAFTGTVTSPFPPLTQAATGTFTPAAPTVAGYSRTSVTTAGSSSRTHHPREQPVNRCHYCPAPFETTIIGWAGICGWVIDACWPCARTRVDPLG